MNLRTDKPAHRGYIADLLLRAPRERKNARKVLQLPIPKCDDAETVTQSVKVSPPYPNGNKWRLIVWEDGKRTAKLFADRETALRVRERLLSELDGRSSKTVGEAVAEYIEFKRKLGCVERSIIAARDKLAFIDFDSLLIAITPSKAESLYLDQTTKVAAATHHANLKNAKAFFGWCVKQKYLSHNPFSEVQKIGKAKKGKPQLRQDEAKRLSTYLIEKASQGDYRALALLLQVLLGLRSGEVLGLRKRDIDCGGTRVVIEGTKTENARRTVKLEHAPVVMELLAQRIAPLASDSLIFVPDHRDCPLSTTSLHKALVMFCKQAGVPQVCPHSLRGLNATLSVEAGATCELVARALGHGSDEVTRRHYIAPSALDTARSARVASALLGSHLDSVINTLRSLTPDELDTVCASVGYRR